MHHHETVALPGGLSVPENLRAELEKKPKDYTPRTRHLHPNGEALYTNRLILETSPYLLQHAHNPVNWYPWSDEAFAEAKRLGRPVFLSIGYSTCHWCHVMEEESFEDIEIARYLNENYISIKVDREERPDVDAIYMAAVIALTGHGGWPLSVFLTHERQPFHGGTYFPPRNGDRGSRIGFLTLVQQLRHVYDSNPERIASASQSIVKAIEGALAAKTQGDLPQAKILQDAQDYYERIFDEDWGGIGHAPKFPSSLPIRFLLRHHIRTGLAAPLTMAELTLEKMAAGGMYDHVAGGFHRYSVDQFWLVPHFEKMLYDNALLARDYIEAYQLTRRHSYARVARDILNYVTRDMLSPEGGFYSATDADSANPEKGGEREEGWFFTWTPDELNSILGERLAALAKAYFNVTAEGNFEGRNILHTPNPLITVANALERNEAAIAGDIARIKELLLEARQKRPAPLRDEKILTSWNALMISALAQGGFALSQSNYINYAVNAANFILDHMMKDGRLQRSYKNGQARFNAYLEDYAFFIAALLDLFETTHDSRWLDQAIKLESTVAQHFEDKEQGGFFMVSDDHEKLLVREKPSHDGAVPSGNAVMAMNLLKLAALTEDQQYRLRAEQCFKAFDKTLSAAPAAMSEMLLALDFYLSPLQQIVITTPKNVSDAEPYIDQLRSVFLPHKVLAVASVSETAALASRLPWVKERRAEAGKVTAYLCEDNVCTLPTQDPALFAQQLRAKAWPLAMDDSLL